jgi:sphingomyelin phosphodiesterase acid-like 3
MKWHARYLFLFFILMQFPIITSASQKNNFLVIADIHLNQASSHVMEISPSKNNNENDLDQLTFEKLITDVNKNIKNGLVPKPNVIIMLGDILGHVRSSDNILKNESAVFNVLKTNFPSTPIFYTFGNNDSLVADYGPFKNADSPDEYKSPYDVAKLTAGWSNGFLSTGTLCENTKNIFPCIITEDTTNGYYSAYLKSSLRLLSLNSVLFSPRRTLVSEEDAMKQLQWFEEQLKLASQNQESVLITMHIPPGNNVYDHSHFWLPEEQTVFLKIVKKYQHTIIGLLGAHTHAEELKIIRDVSNKKMNGVYFVAGLSTSHGNQPSVKTFYFSRHRGQWLLSNYETFQFSIENSNVLLSKLYDYKNYYCEPQEKKSLFRCLNKLTADKMKKYFSVGNQNYSGTMNSPEDINLLVQE